MRSQKSGGGRNPAAGFAFFERKRTLDSASSFLSPQGGFMSNWDNFNHNIGYAGDFENQSANTTDSDTVCISSPSHTATFSPAPSKPTAHGNTETFNPLTTIVVSSLEKFRDFLDTVTFCGLVLSFVIFILAFISAGIFGPLNEHYGIMKDAYSYACYAGVYSLLSCFALGILYAIVHPE